MKCKDCGIDIPEDKKLKFVGTATVYGYTTIEGFKEAGIEWDVSDSENEEVVCPFCGTLTSVTR